MMLGVVVLPVAVVDRLTPVLDVLAPRLAEEAAALLVREHGGLQPLCGVVLTRLP